MMREYSLRPNRKPSASRKPLLLVVLLGVLLVLVLVAFSSALRGQLFSVFRPLWSAQASVSDALQSAPIRAMSKASLRESLEQAEERLLKADLLLRRYRILEEENIRLKALLGRQMYQEAVLAAVLARPAVTPYDTLIIDAGEDVVAEGDRVVVEGSLVIGTINEVHEHTAQVMLFSAPGVETQVLMGPARTPVTARGQGGGSFVAEFPRDAQVARGDVVVMPGINPYAFATVESAEASASDPFITVRFKNPLNMQALEWVQVLTDPTELPPEIETSEPSQMATTTETTDLESTDPQTTL